MNWVDVRGSRIRYHETGDPATPPVVLLHGIGRSLEDWLPQHDLLADGHRVISLDLPGFGLSQRMVASATLWSLSSGLWGALDGIGETRPIHLMGNSLGGAVAMRMLADQPERVATLALAAPAGFGSEVTFMIRALGLPGMGRPLLRMIDPRTARLVERQIFHDPALVTPERVAMAVRISRQPDFAATYLEIAAHMGGLRGIGPAWRAGLLAELARAPKPTVLMWGDRDRILPSKHLAAARRALPHADAHLLTDIGHMPQLECPAAFAALVRPLLARTVDSTS